MLKDRFEAAFRDIMVIDDTFEIAAGFRMIDWRATHEGVALTGTITGLYSKLANNIDSPAGTIIGFEFVPRTNADMNLANLQGGLVNPIVKGATSNAVLTSLKGLHIKCETEETRNAPTVTIQDCYGLYVETDIKGGDTVVTGNHMGLVVRNFGTSCKMTAGIAIGSGDAAGNMDYGIDMNSAIGEASIVNAPVRMDNDVCILNGTAVPENGVTGADFAGMGSIYVRTGTLGTLYINSGTAAATVWKLVTQAA